VYAESSMLYILQSICRIPLNFHCGQCHQPGIYSSETC